MKNTNKLYFVLGMILTSGLACSLTSQASSSVGGTPISQKSISPPQSNQPCQADKWRLPVDVLTSTAYVHPNWGGTPPAESGWNYVFVFFAVENNSDLWGSVTINANALSITTEGGFTYNPERLATWFPADAFVPDRELQTWDAIVGGWWFQPVYWINTEYFPPKFSAQGTVVPYTTQLFGAIEGWAYIPYNFLFKVAATPKKLTLNISGVKVDCVVQGSKVEGHIPDSVVDLNNYQKNVVFPTTLPSTKLSDLTSSSIVVPDIGTITITGVELNTGNATVKFRFTNANEGADTIGEIHAYIIGDDGYMHGMFGGAFHAGPGQTVDGTDLSTMGGIPEDISNLKIVFEVKSGQGPVFYQVFNFNP
jgi:hypothetical protein